MTQTHNQSDDGDAASISSSHGYQEEKAPPLVLSRRESKAVCGVRMLVLGVLLSMVAIGVYLYFDLNSGEIHSFKEQYREDATKVLASLGVSLYLTLGGLDALVVNMVSQAKASNQTWPFVTVRSNRWVLRPKQGLVFGKSKVYSFLIVLLFRAQIPDFAVRAEKTRSATNTLVFIVYNYVEESQRSAWERYTAVEGHVWLDETLKDQQEHGLYTEANENRTTTPESLLWNTIWDYRYDSFRANSKRQPQGGVI